MQVVLVRHPAAAIAQGLCYGRLDIPLPPSAAAAVAAIVANLSQRRFGRLWTSPARRCRALADAVGSGCGLVPAVDGRLQELDFGAWEGVPWDDVPRTDLDAWAASPEDFAPPGGETGGALLARVGAFCEDIRRAGEDCVVVSHGGPLKVMEALLRGNAPDLLAPAPPLGSAKSVVV